MRTVEWCDGALKMIDQRALPWKLQFVRLESVEAVAESITRHDRSWRAGDWRGGRFWLGAGGASERRQFHRRANL